MDLKGKVVVITGSSKNIGKATALKFAEEGSKVVVHSLKDNENGESTASEIKRAGGQAIYVQADVSNPEDVRRLFQQTTTTFGMADILINNAGYAPGRPFLEATKEDWIKDFDNNFFGTVLCSQAAARIMIPKKSGKILNTASIRGIEHTGREGIMAYSAAKAAVINFTKTLAKELAPAIQVNAVAPGFVITPNYDNIPQEVKNKFIENTLIKRWIQPEEIADAFIYLAKSDAITGEILVVDGGFTLKIG